MEKRIVDLQVLMSSYLMNRWKISTNKFVTLDERYGILEYIRLCYEPFHLTGEEGIAEEIEQYIEEQGGEINMYRLDAKIKNNGKIVGYLLKDKEGATKPVKIENVKNIIHQIQDCKLTRDGYIKLENGKMSNIPEVPLTQIKGKQENKPKTIKVTDNQTLITTASKGDQSKWKVENLWVKADTQGFEGLAEEFSSLFLSCIHNISYVPYYTCIIEKENKEKIVGCYSENMFRNKKESFITFHKLYEQYGLIYEATLDNKSTKERIVNTIEFIKQRYDVDITQYIITTLYIDEIILNEDRHPSNLGLIKDMETNKYRIASIFDNGLAFLARENHWGNVPLHVAKRSIKYEPFGNKQVSTLMKMTNYKLLVDKNLLYTKIKGYENPLYTKETVEQTKKILLDNLTMWEGKLWVGK